MLCAYVFACAFGNWTELSAAEPSPDDPFYVLLRNGEVLRGSLERDGDHYLIRRNGSAELRIPYKDISHVGPTMQVLYEHKANRIIEFRADEHLNLASWCLQNKLESQTTHHILRAETIDPFHPHLSLMKARLERFLALGDEAESPANEIALLAAVGNEPIPITRAPFYDAQDTVSGLPPAAPAAPSATAPSATAPSATTPPVTSTPTVSMPPTSMPRPTPNDTQQPRERPVPAIPSIDPPELISDATAADLVNEVELPDLIPAPGAPPTIPAVTINQELIRQVEEKLAVATPNAPTGSREPKQLAANDLLHKAQPLEAAPQSRSDSPANSPSQDPVMRVPAVDPTADLNASFGQRSAPRTSTSPPTTLAEQANGDQDPSQGQDQNKNITGTTSPSAIVEHPARTESLTDSLTGGQRPGPAGQVERASEVPNVSLPPELIRAYVANIQPMLLTRCAASNCHGHATDSKFKLHRVSDRRPSRVMTMRNLASTLEQLDKTNPADSPLFTWGQTVHGQTHSKLLAISNVQQQTLLLQWIQDVAHPPTKPKRTRVELADRQHVFAEGAERISLRKIKQSDIRWQEPTRRARQRLKSAEPANRESRDVQFLATPIAAEPG